MKQAIQKGVLERPNLPVPDWQFHVCSVQHVELVGYYGIQL